jgi:hypothetical protein
MPTDPDPTTSTAETRRRARYYNRPPQARSYQASTDEEVPALRVGGALVSVFVDPCRDPATLVIGVELGQCAPELCTGPDGSVPLEITVQGTTVFSTAADGAS